MRTSIVLIMHGVPPRDFPRREIAEFMSLHNRLEHGGFPPHERAAAEARCAELDARIRNWPRNPENDTFFTASHELAEQLRRVSGDDVVLGFNEFCAPTVPEALDQAAAQAERVVVITPMLTPGGSHAEIDIPAQIADARARHPNVDFVYAWPYAMSDVAVFLAQRIGQLAV